MPNSAKFSFHPPEGIILVTIKIIFPKLVETFFYNVIEINVVRNLSSYLDCFSLPRRHPTESYPGSIRNHLEITFHRYDSRTGTCAYAHVTRMLPSPFLPTIFLLSVIPSIFALLEESARAPAHRL